MLATFARVTRSCLRACDVLGRYGGEEFLLIAPGALPTAGRGVFERVCRAVAGCPLATAAGVVSVTVSIGVAGATVDSTSETLLAAADAALCRAKAEGRDRVAYA